MSNLSYIEELGIGVMPDVETETTDEPNTIDNESDNDLSLEHEDEVAETEVDKTEVNTDMQALMSQINGMEKRIADKDEYINELREASKQKEADNQQEVDTSTDEDEDFWSNPEETIKSLKDELKSQKEAGRIQQLQTYEIHYANTVDDYWKTVNPDSLKEAVSADAEFADKFNNSKEPYKTAYEYLKDRTKAKASSDQEYKDKIIQDYLKDNGISKGKKEVPPNINGGSKSTGSGKKAIDDGFASVFGSGY